MLKTRRFPALLLLLMAAGVAQPETASPASSDPESVTANIAIGKILLPDQVPYLNKREDFFIGNGMAGGGGAGLHLSELSEQRADQAAG
jgi:hypothetical protein